MSKPEAAAYFGREPGQSRHTPARNGRTSGEGGKEKRIELETNKRNHISEDHQQKKNQA
jgi:hypothetical protein